MELTEQIRAASEDTTATPGVETQPQKCSCGRPGGTCGCGGGSQSPTYVYALGSIEARFPSAGVEKEFAQAAHEARTINLSDREVLYNLLRQHRYLAREVCWVFRVQGLETYILLARDSADLDQLIEAVKPAPLGTHRDLMIGTRGPLAKPEMCNGLIVPLVLFERIYSFSVPDFLASIPLPAGADAQTFQAMAEELFWRIMQLTDNAGADPYRALNYLAVRYSAIYAHAAEMAAKDCFLSAVDVKADPLSSARKISSVILLYTNRKTDVGERFFVRVDTTEKWPFLVSKLQPYLGQSY